MTDLHKKLLIIVVAVASCAAVMFFTPKPGGPDESPLAPAPAPPPVQQEPQGAIPAGFEAYAKKHARIKTRHGDMVARFFPQLAPNTVKNFCDLAQKGYYNGIIFHRVIKGFMIQGGDPTGTGMSGPGYTIKAEFNNRKHTRGTLSMARSADPDSAGSQFFIVHGPHASNLDHSYTAFGELVSGFDVLDKIATAPTGENDRPVDPVKMDSVTLEDAP
jgi:peptidyl-prolyl cis-trans isomerase B (cyclophilin B)